MLKDKNLFFLTGDLGYIAIDKIKKDIPKRYFNCMPAEQMMLDFACGIAVNNKIPIVYSITPFLIYRPFETLRTYINHEKIPAKLVGSGRNLDYDGDGVSHICCDVGYFLDGLMNIKQYFPNTIEEMVNLLPEFLYNNKPSFLSLTR